MPKLDTLSVPDLKKKALKLKLDNEKIKKKYGKTRSRLTKAQLIDLIKNEKKFKKDKKLYPGRTACVRTFTKTKENRKSVYTLVSSKEGSTKCNYVRTRYHTGSTKKK